MKRLCLYIIYAFILYSIASAAIDGLKVKINHHHQAVETAIKGE
jgi:hypothetical protein